MNPQNLFLSLGEPIPETIIIKGKEYDTIEILTALERLLGQKIIRKNNGKLYRNWFNRSIQFVVVPPSKIGDPLTIVGRKEFIEIWG
jgi:hypothetical protein